MSYVRVRQRGGIGRMAGPNRLRGVGRLRGLGKVGDGFDWGSFFNTTIQTAGSVAAVALKPPTYSSTINPYTGAQSVTSYAPISSGGLFSGTGLGSSLTGNLSPILVLGALGLGAVLLLRR